jgi:DNA topoisomerase I
MANTETEGSRRDDPDPKLRALARRLGLRYVTTDALSIRRRRSGRGWCYLGVGQRVIRDPAMVRRLARLAVPPAYRDVLYAKDPTAHLQAVGRDDAGRLQYRYHPDWEQAREIRKAGSLARLTAALPRIRRSVGQHLATGDPTREFAAAAVVELVERSAIRPGRESYARERGTRGAATLLKSNVTVSGHVISLAFRSKGGKRITKKVRGARLAAAIVRLRRLPGPRLFQYRAASGKICPLRARQVNAFLREIAGVDIALKDFRTLFGSASVLEALARLEPASSETRRRRQVREAVAATADDLANTPPICRRSYVHDAVVSAFENGALQRFSRTLKGRSPMRRAEVLARIVGKSAG